MRINAQCDCVCVVCGNPVNVLIPLSRDTVNQKFNCIHCDTTMEVSITVKRHSTDLPNTSVQQSITCDTRRS